MTPEAIALTERRIELDSHEFARLFARAVAQRNEEFASRGVSFSSMAVLAVHSLAGQEFEVRARAALRTAQRVLTADDSEPSDVSQEEIRGLVRKSVEVWASDVDELYRKQCDRMKGSWPTLDEPRERAVNLAFSELEIDFLARKRKRPPVADLLRAPRYEAAWRHWQKAQFLAAGSNEDFANAIKEGVMAIEALAKVVAPGNATLGDCIKALRADKRIDPGADKMLEGLWIFASSAPGIRHGAETVPTVSETDWRTLKSMIDGLLSLLLSVDASLPVV